jgi:probable rRNA maturation factor
MARQVKGLKRSSVEAGSSSTLQRCNAATVEFTNRQRSRKLNLPLLRRITEAALAELPGVSHWNLTFHLVGAKQIARINETHLGHQGPTDVITFDYAEHATRDTRHVLHGEIFICVEIAVSQAREFRTSWQSETIRYVVHALLHLCGYDDLQPAARRKMKVVENRLVRKLARRFDFSKLGGAGGKPKSEVRNPKS